MSAMRAMGTPLGAALRDTARAKVTLPGLKLTIWQTRLGSNQEIHGCADDHDECLARVLLSLDG
jgi:hypothetical protein